MITTKLTEVIEKRGVTLYWVSKTSGIPYVSLWALSQKEKKGEVPESIHLSVLSKLCTVLKCKPNDLLHHTVGAEDEALLTLIGSRDGTKKATKKGARAK
ncbi:MAG: helix-turn-helix domain-containing protein [Blastocatellia bacterium]